MGKLITEASLSFLLLSACVTFTAPEPEKVTVVWYDNLGFSSFATMMANAYICKPEQSN